MQPRHLVNEIEHRIDELRRDVRRTWDDLRFNDEHPAIGPRMPACDLVEENDAYVLTAELPGIAKGEIALDVDGHGVRVRAEHKEESSESKPGYVRRERSARSFDRYVRFPEPVSPHGARATFTNGVLDVHVPKAHPDKHETRHIEIG